MGTAAAIVGVGVAGTVGQVIAGSAGARARGRAAEAELGEARATRELALEAAEPSPEELSQMTRAVELNEQVIARKERLIESADPAVIEAGRQALQLLQGEEAKTLDPIKRQRQEQRSTLQDRLQAQLGTGFETSTAGIQALNDFDQGTDSLLAQEQDRSLGRLLGIAERTTQQQGLAGAASRSINLANLLGGPSRRRVAAIQGTPITPFAGAPFVESAQQAQVIGSAFGQIAGGASTALTLGALTGNLGGAKPTLGTAEVAGSRRALAPEAGRFGGTRTGFPRPAVGF